MQTFCLVAALALAGGCSSGKGGGSGGSGPVTDPALQPLRAGYEPSPCGTLYGYPVQCVPNQRNAIDEAMKEAEAAVRAMPVEQFELFYGYTPYWASSSTSSAAKPGNPGLNSAELDFEYQSFGVWNEHTGFNGGITAWSHGQATPGQAVPTTGSATFTGKLLGLYVSPAGTGAMAGANVTVDANFSSRSLGFASSGSALQGSPAPQLDLRGTLTYAPGQSAFSGTLTNASGSLSGSSKGQFYGPKAEELGGAFMMKGSGAETFAGAYGAKR